MVAGAASIVSCVLAARVPDPSTSELLFSIFLIFITFICLLYVFIVARGRLHRYAETVYYYHYVNHILRDYTAQIVHADTCDRNLDDLLADVLTAIATCFSIVTGKQCRCCIKNMNKDQEIIDVKRDNVSAAQAESQSILGRNDVRHTLEKNTDFYNLWYAEDGCKRAYLSNDLRDDYRYCRYRNSSFEVLGAPQIGSFLGYTYVERWTLPYRSALVLPIRYISEFRLPSKKDADRQDANPHWKCWGFLCIDCNSSNVFDPRYSVELGGAFADLLYSLFNELDLAEASRVS